MFDHCKSLILKGGLCNNLYIMNMQVANYIITNMASLSPQSMDANLPLDHALIVQLTTSSVPLNLWHCCLDHLNFNAVKCMVDKGLVTGMILSNRDMPTGLCKPCLEGKQTYKVIHKIAMMHIEHMLGHIHTDVCSPIPTPIGTSLHSLTTSLTSLLSLPYMKSQK